MLARAGYSGQADAVDKAGGGLGGGLDAGLGAGGGQQGDDVDVTGGALPGQRGGFRHRQVHDDKSVNAAFGRAIGKGFQSVVEQEIVVGHYNQRRIRDLLPHGRYRSEAIVGGYAFLQGAETGFLNDGPVGYRVAEGYGDFDGVGAGGGQGGYQFPGGRQVGAAGCQIDNQARPLFLAEGGEFFFDAVSVHSWLRLGCGIGLETLSRFQEWES